MCVIGYGETNNENTRTNASSMISDKNQEFKFDCFSNNYSSCVHIKIGKLV